ncbi:MAG: phosphatase PAP2 family protein [Nanoarchaeota archaeon]|nr:phosphatase PAP2 family protein [Nanoarchaeota archaeon]MCG2718554.1 phosphatase PAP2 family protein [Nanoarchaeota archaeon]
MKKINYLWVIFALTLASFFYDKKLITLISYSRVSLLDSFMAWISNPLTTILLFAIITLLLFREKRKRDWILPLWLIILSTWVSIGIIKFIVGRIRPFEALTLPLVKGASYSFSAWNASFPSMHAAGAFAMIPVINKFFPRLKWFWIILSVVMAMSRLYLGVHYLSDIIVGATIGVLISKGIITSKEKRLKK